MPSCCKCLFEKITANVVHFQTQNLQNVRKMHFCQNAPGFKTWCLLTILTFFKTCTFRKYLKRIKEIAFQSLSSPLNIQIGVSDLLQETSPLNPKLMRTLLKEHLKANNSIYQPKKKLRWLLYI